MKIKDIIALISFLRKSNGCIVMDDDLNLCTFGTKTPQIKQCNDIIMHTFFDKNYK